MERLTLHRPSQTDLAELHELHADERVWRHFPQGSHSSVEQTDELLAASIDGWERTGLDFWIARDDGDLVGMGGVRLVEYDGRPALWNVYYRVPPEMQGRGIALSLAQQGIAAAVAHSPQLPVIARMMSHNAGSISVARRAGLSEVWRGADSDDPTKTAVRYADRYPTPELVARWAG